MDTEKFKTGWVLALVSGSIPKDLAKLKRRLSALGFQKLQTNVYARSCCRMADDIEAGRAKAHSVRSLAEAISAAETRETCINLIAITRAQWERSYSFMGLPGHYSATDVQHVRAQRPIFPVEQAGNLQAVV